MKNHADITTTLQAEATAASARLGTDIRVSYIGNCDSRSDNRLWGVRVEGIRGGYHYNNTLSTPEYRTENLAALLAYVENGGIDETIAKAKGRWDAEGQFHSGYRFSPVRDVWGEVVETPAQVAAALAGVKPSHILNPEVWPGRNSNNEDA